MTTVNNIAHSELTITGYDIIGDVHGCATSLMILLDKMAYQECEGVYRYTGAGHRKVLFLGDLVDRGPQIRKTLAIVKAMVDAGHAEMILGNHEFSAIAYFTPVKKGFLRPHNLRSDEQIRETIAQFEGYAQEWLTYLQWFKTLPLFLEFDDFRVVHACWDYRLITEYQETYQSNALSVERILECEDQNSLVYRCIDRLTRGISLHLPDGLKMQGRDGYLRHSFRVNFWRENPVSYDDVHFQPDRLPEPLSQRLLTEAEKSQINHYAKHEKLLFIGHYWLEGKPAPVAENIACLDYSAVHNGQLVAYRFDVGDKVLSAQSYVSVCSSDLPRGTVNG